VNITVTVLMKKIILLRIQTLLFHSAGNIYYYETIHSAGNICYYDTIHTAGNICYYETIHTAGNITY